MPSQITLEDQIFWKPPIAVRHDYDPQAKQPPPLEQQRHCSFDTVARQEVLPPQKDSRNTLPTSQGHTSDEPITIPSDAESDEDDTEDDNGRGARTSPCSQWDNTLPSIPEIAASIAKARCGSIHVTEGNELIHENADETAEAEHFHCQSFSIRDNDRRGDGYCAIGVFYGQARELLCYIMPTHAIHSPPAAGRRVTGPEPANPPDTPEPGGPLRRSRRNSATPSNGRSKALCGGNEARFAHRTIAARSSESAGSCRSRYSGHWGDVIAQAENAVEDDPDDNDGHGDGQSHDDDYCPSSAEGDKRERESDCRADVMDDDAEQAPRKRRMTRRSISSTHGMTRRSMSSTHGRRGGTASPFTAKTKAPSMPKKHASVDLLPSPPLSAASTDSDDTEADSATFEEWGGTVKLTTINDVTSFQGQFEGELSLKLLQALLLTLSATHKGRCAPARGRAGRAKRNPGPWGKFTPEGQVQDDEQPPPIEDEDAEWLVETIKCARWKNLGRGRRRECLVKWQGYHEPTWVPLENLKDTIALDDFERLYGPATENDGPRKAYERAPRRRGRPPNGLEQSTRWSPHYRNGGGNVTGRDPRDLPAVECVR
ncbi:hypothetical protein FOMA001_g13751 [Fusarium oxysporum f. sp. matthiolae]|nr:hypothetical protein FOMA001_g13751 [Fusarium oxysporum f. sp. matthiolae]